MITAPRFLFARTLLTPGLQTLVVALCAYWLLYQQMGAFASDPGVGWHLADGKIIAQTLSVPLNDPFLSESRRWVSDQWLSDLILYKGYAIGGWPVLYGMLAATYLLTFCGVLYFYTARASGSYCGASLATLLACKVSLLHFILRPVVFAFALFAIITVVVFQYLRVTRQDERALPGWLFATLPTLFLLWAQAHPSFVLGLLLLLLTFLGGLGDLVLMSSVSVSGLWKRGALLALCAGATVINPNGIDLHKSIVSLGQSDYFMRLNREWLPPDPLAPEGIISLTLFAIVVFGGLLFRRELRWGSFEWASVILFGFLAARSVRLLPFFAMVVVVPASEVFRVTTTSSMVSSIPVLRLLAPVLERLEARETRLLRGGVILFGLVVVLMGDPLLRGRVLSFSGPFGPLHSLYPYEAVAAIIDDSRGVAARRLVVTLPDWGGFVVWEGQGMLAPTIDDRNTLSGEEAYRDIFSSIRSVDGIIDYTRRKGGDYILLPQGIGSRLNFEGRDDSRTLFADEQALVISVRR